MSAGFTRAVGVALLAIAACTPPPDAVPSGGAPGAGETLPAGSDHEDGAIQFASTYEGAAAGQFQGEFTLFQTRDIFAVIPVSTGGGMQFVKFDVYRPMGALHREVWRAYTDDAVPPDRVPHPTMPAQVPVDRVVAGDRGLIIGIPVAGTQMVQFRLHGEYTVVAHLGADADAPTVEGRFQINLPPEMQ